MLRHFTIAQGGQKRPKSKPKICEKGGGETRTESCFRSSLKTIAGGQLRQDFNTYYQYVGVVLLIVCIGRYE